MPPGDVDVLNIKIYWKKLRGEVTFLDQIFSQQQRKKWGRLE